ncbi:MarR family winged helix-turn-helix transcriptional regulator [Kitasatospora sp. NPDC002040]|uniref:MarR family winged helix-turn-helix transcriptional regulator n=1 Tax=Kitasatospora sp. NPDC002040 TaxID=3154661 RepID=UPI003317158B
MHLLSTAGRAVETLLAERSSARGLSPLHRSLLETLTDLGPHARTDLAAQVEAPEADALRVVDELVAQELAQVMVVHIGGRHQVVALTPAGTAALGAVQDDTASVQDELLASLTRGERTQLHYLLRRVCATAARGSRVRALP